MNSPMIRVGLLAYGAIGHEHNEAITATPGLTLAAICDTNPERVAEALTLAPAAAPFADATAMLDSHLVDLVVISTPPNSHYRWAKEALRRGIHVILEKPMALTTDECDDLMALAATSELLLVVYQNRQFDADFRTIAALIAGGEIGEAFQYDSFVGGYSKPCSYWHSDALVSGGAIFDWGSHFLDQLLTIVKEPVAHVSGINHKRHWLHVTNADHAQVTVTFADGALATFTNSDLAAARKPKYYILGTTGAIVGDWDPQAEPAVADLPAIITLHRADGTKQVIESTNIPPHSFHHSVVEYLMSGAPMGVSARQSRDVVAIMEAAEASASNNGWPVTPHLLR